MTLLSERNSLAAISSRAFFIPAGILMFKGGCMNGILHFFVWSAIFFLALQLI